MSSRARSSISPERTLRGIVAGLAQLRERFREKRSTDVPEPDDERRKRDRECRDLGGNVVADARPVQRCHRSGFRRTDFRGPSGFERN